MRASDEIPSLVIYLDPSGQMSKYLTATVKLRDIAKRFALAFLDSASVSRACKTSPLPLPSSTMKYAAATSRHTAEDVTFVWRHLTTVGETVNYRAGLDEL